MCSGVCPKWHMFLRFLLTTKWGPLHTAALNGHLEVYKVVMDLVVDKNPRSMCHLGHTPLHSVAQKRSFG